MIDFEDFEDEQFGLTLADLTIPPGPLPDLPPTWQKPRWYQVDGRQSLEEYAADTIRRYAQPTLDRLDAGDDDLVFEHQDKLVSLNTLTAPFEPWRTLPREIE